MIESSLIMHVRAGLWRIVIRFKTPEICICHHDDGTKNNLF